jgi:hypothetical protein
VEKESDINKKKLKMKKGGKREIERNIDKERKRNVSLCLL